MIELDDNKCCALIKLWGECYSMTFASCNHPENKYSEHCEGHKWTLSYSCSHMCCICERSYAYSCSKSYTYCNLPLIGKLIIPISNQEEVLDPHSCVENQKIKTEGIQLLIVYGHNSYRGRLIFTPVYSLKLQHTQMDDKFIPISRYIFKPTVPPG